MEDLDLNGKTHRVEFEVDTQRGNIYTTLHDRPESAIATLEASPDDGPQDFEYRCDMAAIMVDRCNAYPELRAAADDFLKWFAVFEGPKVMREVTEGCHQFARLREAIGKIVR